MNLIKNKFVFKKYLQGLRIQTVTSKENLGLGTINISNSDLSFKETGRNGGEEGKEGTTGEGKERS